MHLLLFVQEIKIQLKIYQTTNQRVLIQRLKDFKNDSESLEIAPRLFCDDTFKYSSKNCGLGAYVYYKFKDKKDNNLAVRFDHEQTNLTQRTKFRFYQNLNIPDVSRNKDSIKNLSDYKSESPDSKIKGLIADMSDAKSTENFIKETLEDGPIDILVNNVGASPSRNFLYMSDQDWQDLHELNLLSAVRCTRSFLPHMREQKWGRVIMISSSAGKYPSAALIDYGATKSAMISISKSLAKKYGRDGVLVNSVLPGLIHTAMWERAAGEIAESSGSSAEEVIKKNGFSVPIGRYGTSEEVAALVVFLCSNAASYINGSAIEVDGGQAGHI